jgi:hypothetical protein
MGGVIPTQVQHRKAVMSESYQTYKAASKRLRRKLEIIKLDTKNQGFSVYQDVNETIMLLDIIDRAVEEIDNEKYRA